ncbi:MAG TPA: EamA family transporter [Vicinamibacterales bacterium]|nr:EamA family transporter [Vicinamibacterales bacterium]
MVTVLAYAAIYLIWGSTFLAIRIAVGSIPPLLMMGVRCLAAGVLLVAWARLRGDRMRARDWGHAAIAGALMFGCAYGALAWAEQRIPSGVAALVVATLPLWVTALEWAQRGSRPSSRALAGVAIGFGGVALLVMRGTGAPLALLPIAVVALGEGAWAVGSLYARPPRLPKSVALNAGMPLLAGGVLLTLTSWAAGELRTFHARDPSTASVAALGYLVIFGSIVAFSAYAWLMQVSAPWRVGTHAYVNPLIAVALGAALADEPLTAALVVSAAVIAGSVALILADRLPDARRDARRPPASAAASVLRARPVVSSLRETRQPGPA